MSSTSRHNGGGPAGTTAAYRGVPPSPTAAEAAQHPTSAPAKPASAFESGAPASIRPQLPPGHVPGQAFDPTYTAQLFQACAKHKEAVPLDVFLDGCTEIRGLIGALLCLQGFQRHAVRMRRDAVRASACTRFLLGSSCALSL